MEHQSHNVSGRRIITHNHHQILHVPKMKNSLISVSRFIFKGFKVEFDKDGCKVNDVQKVVVAEAQKDNNLYLLNVKL